MNANNGHNRNLQFKYYIMSIVFFLVVSFKLLNKDLFVEKENFTGLDHYENENNFFHPEIFYSVIQSTDSPKRMLEEDEDYKSNYLVII